MNTKMATKVKAFGAGLAISVGTLAGVLLTAAPAHAETMLGGVQMQEHGCNVQWAGGIAHANSDTNAYSWVCVMHDGYGHVTNHGLNVNAACNDQYGGGAYGKPLNASDAYSWRCYR